MDKAKIISDIKNLEFTTGTNFSYDLTREFELISSYLNSYDRKILSTDFDQFSNKGRFAILNTFAGGILFLKEAEGVDRIRINWKTRSASIEALVIYQSESRRPENIKYKTNAGKIESTEWDSEMVFPNFNKYDRAVQVALLIVLGKIIKRICEYGRTHLAHLNIENAFDIELQINDQTEEKLDVEIS